ncbi:MAG: glycosyltransferase [Bdellovibrionales bacterium]|nr:glycosyltransferase [Bdellovibrionales bacterium]
MSERLQGLPFLTTSFPFFRREVYLFAMQSSATQQLMRVWRHHGVIGIFDRVLTRAKSFLALEDDAEERGGKLWLEKQRPLPRESYEKRIEQFEWHPLLSLLVPVCDPPIAFLQELLHSVQEQVYENWELVLVDDASENSTVREVLESAAADDGRIKIHCKSQREHIAKTSQAALQVATGDYLGLLDHDDVLPLHALFHIVEALQHDREIDILYSDEAKMDSSGALHSPQVKPDWSPMYFRSFMYVGHLTVYSRTVIEAAGGFREGTDGSQDYDLLLRASVRARKIVHIPRVLYYWREHQRSVASDVEAKGYAFDAARDALRLALEREGRGESLELVNGPYPGTILYRSKKRVPEILTWIESESLEQLSQRVEALDSDAVYLTREGFPIPSEEELRYLAAPLEFSAVSAPLLVDSQQRMVVSAGHSRLPGKFLPNFQGQSLARGGSGHRLYVPFEVDAVSLLGLCLSREVLLSLLSNSALASTSALVNSGAILNIDNTSIVVVPQVRIVAKQALMKQPLTLLCGDPLKHFYPIGYATSEASFQFSSAR